MNISIKIACPDIDVKKIIYSLKFCHKKVVRKTAVGVACFRRGGRGKEKTGGGRVLEFKEYKSL